jgi:hypothetical protein
MRDPEKYTWFESDRYIPPAPLPSLLENRRRDGKGLVIAIVIGVILVALIAWRMPQ